MNRSAATLLTGATSFFSVVVMAILLSGCQPPEPGRDLPSQQLDDVLPTLQIESTVSPPPIVSPMPTISLSPTEVAPQIEPRAADAAVLHVKAVNSGQGSWAFHVTVAHPDRGWDDYADGWDVVLPDGTVAKPDADSPFTRLLLHPHVDEQPFIRSQSGIILPEDVTSVRVRAHDLRDGFGGPEVVVDLTVASGPGFDVER